MKRTLLISVLLSLFIILGVSIKGNKSATLNPQINLPDDCVDIKNFPGISQETTKIKKGKSGYFPDKTFAEGWESGEVFINDWYGKHLKTANEKSLLDTSDKDLELYRFTWLRTFHHPVIVRIEKQKDKVKIFFKELDGAGGYEPGKIFAEKENSIDKKDWCEFTKLLNDTDYWQMPSREKEIGGEDGSRWILEGVKENRCHIVDIWSPDKGKYREVGLFMLKLSGFDLDKNKDDLY